MEKPEYLQQGESARLFPVLSTSSKEKRLISVFLACLSKVDEFGHSLLVSIGKKVGKRGSIVTYTEVVFKSDNTFKDDRPDGLIVVKTGSREWRALVEAKVGANALCEEQTERYRSLAKEYGVDCLITISNQFTASPKIHPLERIHKKRSKIPVFHWSWMSILTTVDILLNNQDIADTDQSLLLNEFRRFLSHESSGVRGFNRMPAAWSDLNRLILANGTIPAKSPEAYTVLEAWHQETRNLALILSRQTETFVIEKLPRKHMRDPKTRLENALKLLREKNYLYCCIDIPDSAAPIEIRANIARRILEVGMTISAPEDKKSSKARVNWLIRQVKSSKTEDIHIRLNWPGRSEITQFPFSEISADPSIIEQGKSGLQVVSFHIYLAKPLGSRFAQQTNFITDLETLIPQFYREIGQNLTAWRKPPPRIRDNAEHNMGNNPETDMENSENGTSQNGAKSTSLVDHTQNDYTNRSFNQEEAVASD